ncbi:MAG: hypothetical protein AAGD25_21085 [Cyanobacteria bacterium P01_F01_bin.150]
MADQNEDTFDTKLDRIAEQVEAIAHFVGHTEEVQMQTQSNLDEMMELNRQTHAKLDRITDNIAGLTSAMNGYQDIARGQARSTAELIKLVTMN